MEYPELVQIKADKRDVLADLIDLLSTHNKMNLLTDNQQLRNVVNPKLDVVITNVLEAILTEMERVNSSNVNDDPMNADYEILKNQYDELERKKNELTTQMRLRLDTRANPQPVPGGKKRKSMKRKSMKRKSRQKK